MPSLTKAQGQAAGWWPGANNTQGIISPWQEDYLTSVADLAAAMGDPGALSFVNWQKDRWLAGRFLNLGLPIIDGIGYRAAVSKKDNFAAEDYFTTWGEIEAMDKATGFSNTKWLDYGPEAHAALGGALTLFPSDPTLLQAYRALLASSAPDISTTSLQKNPTFNVVPLE